MLLDSLLFFSQLLVCIPFKKEGIKAKQALDHHDGHVGLAAACRHEDDGAILVCLWAEPLFLYLLVDLLLVVPEVNLITDLGDVLTRIVFEFLLITWKKNVLHGLTQHICLFINVSCIFLPVLVDKGLIQAKSLVIITTD